MQHRTATLCALPSRVSLLTGHGSARHGVFTTPGLGSTVDELASEGRLWAPSRGPQDGEHGARPGDSTGDSTCSVGSANLPTMGQFFAEAGYDTAYAGSWDISAVGCPSPKSLATFGFQEVSGAMHVHAALAVSQHVAGARVWCDIATQRPPRRHTRSQSGARAPAAALSGSQVITRQRKTTKM